MKRLKPIIFGGASSGVSQFVNLLLTVITSAIIQREFGTAMLGLWLTLISIVALSDLFDFGVGNSIIYLLSSRRGARDRHIEAYVVNGLFITILIALLLLMSLVTITEWQLWPKIIGYSQSKIASDETCLYLLLSAYFSAAVLISPLEKYQISQQRTHLPRLANACGGLFSLVVFATGALNYSNMGQIFFIRFFPILVIRTFVAIAFFPKKSQLISGARNKISIYRMSITLSVGFPYFIMGLSGFLALSTDVFIISHIAGVDSVPQYAIPFRLYIIPAMLMGLVSIPLWPAYGKAANDHQTQWITTTFYRILNFGIVFALAWVIAITALIEPIVRIWLGKALYIPFGMCVGQSLWALLSVMGASMAPILNSAGAQKFQARQTILMLVINLPLSIFLVRLTGPQGAIWGSCAAVSAAITVPSALRVRSIFRSYY